MQPESAPDFFNNVAAIAVVLMFTKVVTHRLRKFRRKEWTRALAILHAIAVVSAAVAVTASLIATDIDSVPNCLHIAAWAGLAVAGIILIADIIIDEFPDAETRRRRHQVARAANSRTKPRSRPGE